MQLFDASRGFGVYIHWPYCARVCPYCDFNVYALKSRSPKPLLDAICNDLRASRRLTGPRVVETIFLGGGTPSLLEGNEIEQLIQCVGELWSVSPDAEITLEANPDDRLRFGAYSEAGVTRLSLGAQSLRDDSLEFLGRNHTAADIRDALQVAESRFRSVSLDLIYALPGQDVDDWRRELSGALALNLGHLSLYELSIEPGAAFSRAVRRGDWSPPDDDLAADLYEVTQRMCEDAGYIGYEISNHARTLSDRSRHNRTYWRCGDWVGVGPGAHGRLTISGERLATETLERPAAYQNHVGDSGGGPSKVQSLGSLEQIRERVVMGLRLEEGLPLDDFRQLGFEPPELQITELEDLGFITRSLGRIRLTLTGRLAADRVSLLLSP
jgi:oxygen-independent coproporphyrinogen-3 oxidase